MELEVGKRYLIRCDYNTCIPIGEVVVIEKSKEHVKLHYLASGIQEWKDLQHFANNYTILEELPNTNNIEKFKYNYSTSYGSISSDTPLDITMVK